MQPITHGAAQVDSGHGVVYANGFDCDGQGAVGARLVVGGLSDPDVLYAGGTSSCRFDTPADAITRCGRSLLRGVPGRYPLGLEREGATVDGPTVVIEANSFVFVPGISPR